MPASLAGTQRLLALGDSFTIGTGSSVDEAFPARLAERWRAAGCTTELRNVAVNGYTSRDVIDRELPEVARFSPTWITLAVGANDLVRRVPEETYRDNVRLILATATKVTPKDHVLVLPQPDWARSEVGQSFGITQEDVDRFDAVLREEASAVGARFVDLESLMRAQAEAHMVASDGLHPNAAAHAEWAEAIGAVATGCR
ncbi:MAG: SGNH/GDSL hydrolase family protein [Polyangiales bacterium]